MFGKNVIKLKFHTWRN